VTAGFTTNMRVRVSGFTGNVANNILVGVITALTAGKMTIGGADGNVIVDDAAGESVTISRWVSRRATAQDIADLASGLAYTGGLMSVPILAAAMQPTTTNGAAAGSTETTTNKVMLVTLDFDQTTDEFAQFMFPMPKSWNEGTVTFQPIWTASTGSGDVVWGMQAVAFSNDDPLDAAFGTAQLVTDTVLSTGDQHTGPTSSAITIGGTPAEGDLVCFQVYRDANNGSDTLAADAKLIGIRLFITTNAGTDA
jgi:hypothetical protein